MNFITKVSEKISMNWHFLATVRVQAIISGSNTFLIPSDIYISKTSEN